MNIGLLAVDSNYPNLALMKISSYHKARGDKVDWYNPFDHYDKVYMAKVFSFTEDYRQWITNADQIEKGGTGYDIKKVLLPEIDRMIPDYDLYNVDKNLAYGFLTRGCPNKCKWCVVPTKEGKITTYADKGVTPFIIRCSCGGLMQHTRSFKNVPDYIRVFRWKRPTLEQTMKLSKGMMEHVLNGGLVLDIDDEDLEERRKYEEY